MRSIMAVAFVGAMLLAGCTPADEEEAPPAPPGAPEAPPPPGPAPEAVVFDPATVEVGDTLVGLVVREVGVEPAAEPYTGYTGAVVLEGPVQLTGRWIPHPDATDDAETCFRPEPAEARKLPRFAEDERYVWFCFEDAEAAARLLGEPGTTGTATIVIDRYRTVRSLTDVVDTARLVRVVDRRADG